MDKRMKRKKTDEKKTKERTIGKKSDWRNEEREGGGGREGLVGQGVDRWTDGRTKEQTINNRELTDELAYGLTSWARTYMNDGKTNHRRDK